MQIWIVLLIVFLANSVGGARNSLADIRKIEFLRSIEFVAHQCKKLGDLIYDKIQSESEIEVSHKFEYEEPFKFDAMQIELTCYAAFPLETDQKSWSAKFYETGGTDDPTKCFTICEVLKNGLSLCTCETGVKHMVEVTFKEYPDGRDGRDIETYETLIFA